MKKTKSKDFILDVFIDIEHIGNRIGIFQSRFLCKEESPKYLSVHYVLAKSV